MHTGEEPEPTPTPSPLSRVGSWPVVLSVLLLANVVGAGVTALLAGPIGDPASTPGFGARSFGDPRMVALAILATDAALLAGVYLVVIRRRVAGWRDLGLRPSGTRSPVLVGLGYGFVFVVVSGSVSLALAAFGVQQDQAAMFPMADAGPWARAALVTAGVVFAPVAEELFFRGFVFQAMAARKGLVRGLVYSSVLFAAVHGNVAAFLPLIAGSAVLAYSLHRTGTLWVPIFAHAFNNAFAFAALLLSSNAPPS